MYYLTQRWQYGHRDTVLLFEVYPSPFDYLPTKFLLLSLVVIVIFSLDISNITKEALLLRNYNPVFRNNVDFLPFLFYSSTLFSDPDFSFYSDVIFRSSPSELS